MTEQKQGVEINTPASPFKGLFENLSHVITVSRYKFDTHRATNNDKMKWARLLISGCQAYADLLETVKLESIEKRIQVIEERQIK